MLEQGELEFSFLGHYEGFITRLVAFGVDRLIVGIIALFTVMAVRWVLNAFYINQLLFGWDESPARVASVFGVVVYVIVALGYDIVFLMLAGQTPGKQLVGVRVIRVDGERLRLWNVLRRHVGYVISGILFLGFLWILFDNRRQGWHDKLAGTIVVYSWPEEEVQGTMVRDRLQRIAEERRTASPPRTGSPG
jgi:uncharacterized RDD family membrane protein YckC